MRRFFSIYATFFKQQLKSLMEYKMDFTSGMIALGFQQVSSFVVLFAVFTQIEAIGSYSFDEMLLFFGWAQLLKGIDHVYNDNIWTVGWMRIRDGSFNQFLTRPLGVISQIVMERIQLDGFGELIIGGIIFVYAFIRLGLSFAALDWIVFLFFIVCGLTVYFALKLLGASVAFWTVSSGEFMTVTYEIGSFTRYPLDMYKNRFLRFVLIYVLPFALITWVPMTWFIREPDFIAGVLGIPWANSVAILLMAGGMSLLLLTVSLTVWRLGLRRYNATGT